jgi:hypothetical protein
VPVDVRPETESDGVRSDGPDEVGASDHPQIRQGFRAGCGCELLSAVFGLRERLRRRTEAEHLSFGAGARRRSACYTVDTIGAGGVKE